MPIRLKILLWFTIGMLSQYTAFAQDIHFTIVDPPKEDPWTGVYGITQDPHGYLWLATGGGLYKYDGNNYTFYRHEAGNPNSLAVKALEHVFADENGIIWIATFGGGMERLDPETGIFTHFRHHANDKTSLLDDRVSCIIKDREGMMWIGTNGGLEKFDPKIGRFTHFAHNETDANSLSNNQVRVIYEDSQGTIWVGTGSPNHDETPIGEGGLNKLDKKTGKFTRYLYDSKNPNGLIDSRVQAIFEDSRGTFWVGTAGDGLHTMDRKTGVFNRYPYDPAHPEKLSAPPERKIMGTWDDHITFINEDGTGKIWIGSFGGGVNVYNPSNQKAARYSSDLNSKEKINPTVWRTYKTRDGIFWLTTWGPELYKISPYQHNIPYTRVGSYVGGITEDQAGTLWLSTGKGLIHLLANGQQALFNVNKKTDAPKTYLFQIEKDGDNILWLASNTGLYRFVPSTGAFTNYHHEKGNVNSLVSDTITCLKKGAPGVLWIGTHKGLDRMDTKTGLFKHSANSPKDTTSLTNSDINVVEADKNNNVWVGTSLGLNKLDKKTGRFKRYLKVWPGIGLLNDSSGNFWVSSLNGFYKYDYSKDTFTNLDLGTMYFYVASEDHQKNLWLTTSGGIIKLNTQSKESNIYGKSQGIDVNTLATAGYTRRNGEILYGDTGGYFTFQPEKLLHSIPAPAVAISGFFLNEKPVARGAGGVLTASIFGTNSISLNHTQGTFSFSFSTIDFAVVPGDDHTFYMLENYESKWRKAIVDENANYYNIPPGQYIFKVKSVNANGLVTEKHITVIISPPWWQTWWAYTLFALAFAGSIWGFIWYRSRALIREKRVLEHKVHVRTEEVMQQKEEIEAQRDEIEKAFGELKTTQTQLIQSEKMASLGELTAGIAHEIQNPLNFVNNFSEVSIELLEELQQEAKNGHNEDVIALAGDISQNLEKINHHGKRADSIVKGMLEHSRSLTGQKEPTDINQLADEYLRLSYHGLRAKDKSFNAELITNFDATLPKVNAIPQDMGRVLLNLFNNAFYAVNQKQKKAGADYKPEVSVSTSAANGQVIIKVKDNGNGIPEAIKEKIMQPFFTTKPTGEGTGLGLSLTYDMVVKGHGGSIAVESKEGEGSEFTITLPV